MSSTAGRSLARWTLALLVIAVLIGVLTLLGSLYYAFGMDSSSETLFRLAQAACFTTEGPEFVERCAPLTRATVEGDLATFFSALGLVSWGFALTMAALGVWLLARRATPLLPRWAAWVFVVGCAWLLLVPLDKLRDEGYAEGEGTPVVGILSQYLPSSVGDYSARVWLGSSGSTAQTVGQVLNQAVMLWALAMLVVSVLWLLRREGRRP